MCYHFVIVNTIQQIVFWTGNSVEALILLRLAVNGNFRRYLLFSSYLLLILLRSLIDLWVVHFHPAQYSRVYWYATEPLSATLGSLVIFELYRKILELFPGVARIAKKLIAVVFVLVVSRFFAYLIFSHGSRVDVNVLTLLRDLRIVQAVFLIGIVALVWHYSIAIGANLRGMVGGYGVYIGLGLLDLTLRAYLGDSSQAWWNYVHQSLYLVVLGIWVWALWQSAPMPVNQVDSGLESDYRALVQRTTAQLDRAYEYLSRSVNP